MDEYFIIIRHLTDTAQIFIILCKEDFFQYFIFLSHFFLGFQPFSMPMSFRHMHIFPYYEYAKTIGQMKTNT